MKHFIVNQYYREQWMQRKGKLKKTKIYNKENVFKKFVFLHFRTTYKHTEAVTRISNISVLT